MAYRKILVPLLGNERDAHVLNAAFGVAKAFGSHVAGVYVKPDPGRSPALFGRRNFGGCHSGNHGCVARSGEAGRRRRRARHLDQAAQNGRRFRTAVGAGRCRGGWVVSCARGPRRRGDRARRRGSPISFVFASPADARDAAMRATLEAALLNGRKPLLLVPRDAAKIAGAKIAVGWDGGAAAAHAVSSAMPLLKQAEAVEILNVTSGPIDTVQMDRSARLSAAARRKSGRARHQSGQPRHGVGVDRRREARGRGTARDRRLRAQPPARNGAGRRDAARVCERHDADLHGALRRSHDDTFQCSS